MSAFGRKSNSSRVYLNVYDLNDNEYLYPLGLGVYHSGVEISGVEYTFASEAGIYEMTPKHAPPAKFRESIDLGVCPSARELSTAIEELKHDFKGTDYHVLNKNCNHFADMLVLRLLKRHIPGYVNRLAGLGSMFSCLMPQALTGSAPVDGSGGHGGSGSSGTRAVQTAQPFAGAGFKLGNNESSSSSTAPSKDMNSAEGLSDRRERLRAAASRRYDQN